MHLQAVRRSKEAFKLQEDAQYGSSPLFPNQKVPFTLTLCACHGKMQTWAVHAWVLHLSNTVLVISLPLAAVQAFQQS